MLSMLITPSRISQSRVVLDDQEQFKMLEWTEQRAQRPSPRSTVGFQTHTLDPGLGKELMNKYLVPRHLPMGLSFNELHEFTFL